MVKNADRWCELLLEGVGDGMGNDGWSVGRDMACWSDYLVFDVLGKSAFLFAANTPFRAYPGNSGPVLSRS